MTGSVVIDCFPESAVLYRDTHAIVVIDVIRATTTATTAVSLGRRVYPCQTTDEAFVLASRIPGAILIGELGGNMPYGFEMTNSPAQVAERSDVHRPMILVSSSGTQLLLESARSAAAYVGCFRNLSAVAGYVAGRHPRLALIGAGTRGQFRREDQMGCAWIAERLLAAGYEPENPATRDYVARWHGVSVEEVRGGRSAEYLRKSGQERDLEFVLGHIDDLRTVPLLVNGALLKAPDSEPRTGT
jgi:2-phosphosulfolactate phosphatase